jgi:hypothetical protein
MPKPMTSRLLRFAAVAAALACWPAGASAEGLRDFCAERPGATTPPCIMDVGHVMAEVDLLDVSRSRVDGGGWLQSSVAASPHLRLGLTSTIEAGFLLQPYVQQRTSGAASVSGFGDAAANLKISLRNPDGSGVSLALLPYVTMPTAQRGLGAGGFQGGVILPTAIPLPDGFTLALAPEADVLRSAGGGTHGAFLGAISLAHAAGPGLAAAVELIASTGEAPQRRLRQTAAGANLAWTPHGIPDLQLDVGTDVGLSHDAPALRAYIGISRRF